MFSLPSVSSVSSVGCRFGASLFACRVSARALGGFVCVVGFRSFASASLFSVAVAAWLPPVCGGVVARRSSCGRLWLCSVPVLPASAPALVRSGAGPVSAVGSPSAVRSAVAAGGVWSVWPAPFPAPVGRGSAFPVPPSPSPSRRVVFAASLALGFAPSAFLPPRAPVFGSRLLARAWAVACGVPVSSCGAAVRVVSGGFSSSCGPAVSVSCVFCVRLGLCGVSRGGAGCRFAPFLSLPGWPPASPRPVFSRPLVAAVPLAPSRLPGF